MSRAKSEQRKEAMGGLAKGLAVIRAFTRDHAALTLSDIAGITDMPVAALNSSSHSRRISKAKLVRERLSMLQQVSRKISVELAGVPGLSLSASL